MQQNSLGLNKPSNQINNNHNESPISSTVNYLQDFGLTEKEAKIYYILSRLGSASANEISSATQYNRLQTYRSVKGLLDRGIVEISLERPRKYTPLKIEHVISLLQQEAANRIMQLESKKPLLLEKWSEIDDFPIAKANYTFRIVQGSKNVFKFAVMLFDSAKQDIDIAIKGDEIMRWVMEDTDNSLEEKTPEKVRVRVISEFDKNNSPAVQRFVEFCELRHVSSLNTVPIVIIDGKEVLICLNGNVKGVPENAIWTNHPDLVSMMTGFFNGLWSIAKPRKNIIVPFQQS